MTVQSFNDTLHCPNNIRIKRVEESWLDIPFHFHDSCEFIYIEKGFGTRLVGDHVANFTDGDMVLIGPNLPHTWQTDLMFRRIEDFNVLANVIYFKPDFLIEITSGLPDQSSVSTFLQHSLRGILFQGSTRQIIEEKFKEINRNDQLKKIILCLEIIDLLIHSKEYTLLASSLYKNSFEYKDTGRFNTIYQYLTSHYREPITLEDTAAVANMSPKSFCRYFKKHTGRTLVQFVNELRIEHACTLLQDDEYSVSEICYDSGYNNLTHFCNSFKHVTQKTPSEYRKVYLQTQQNFRCSHPGKQEGPIGSKDL